VELPFCVAHAALAAQFSVPANAWPPEQAQPPGGPFATRMNLPRTNFSLPCTRMASYSLESVYL